MFAMKYSYNILFLLIFLATSPLERYKIDMQENQYCPFLHSFTLSERALQTLLGECLASYDLVKELIYWNIQIRMFPFEINSSGIFTYRSPLHQIEIITELKEGREGDVTI